VKNLTKRYVEPYIVENIILKNVVKLKLPVSIRIHLVVNVSRVVRYRELAKRKEPKPIKVDRVEKYVRVEYDKLYFIFISFSFLFSFLFISHFKLRVRG